MKKGLPGTQVWTDGNQTFIQKVDGNYAIYSFGSLFGTFLGEKEAFWMLDELRAQIEG